MKPNLLKLTVVLTLAIAFLSQNACKSSSSNTTTTVCDTSAAVLFSATVKPIMDAKCATSGCHDVSGAGGYSLNTYAGVKACVNSGRFMGSMNQTAGFKAMPQGGNKLDQCDINKIQKWVNAGALNN
jgi:hypothetical protein